MTSQADIERHLHCALDGHDWVEIGRQDVLERTTGRLLMAAWVHLECHRCQDKITLWDPEAQEGAQR